MANEMFYKYKVSGMDMIEICKASMGCDDLNSDFIGLLETCKAKSTGLVDPRKDAFCRWHYHRNKKDDEDCHFKTKDI